MVELWLCYPCIPNRLLQDSLGIKYPLIILPELEVPLTFPTVLMSELCWPQLPHLEFKLIVTGKLPLPHTSVWV
jgi:hypothetical protein